MRKTIIFIMMILLTFLVACKENEGEKVLTYYTVRPFITKGDKTKLLEAESQFDTTLENSNQTLKVEINPQITYQTMDGFGAAMTESSAYLFSNLTENQRNAMFNDLFSNSGIKINFIRVPIGASDFALDNYSYNDIPIDQTDLEMDRFTLERDEQYVIPMLQKVFEINPNTLLIGSPWSAPAWMKDSKTMNGGSLIELYHEAYAKYFVKFIKGYQDAGLPIYAVTPQNEPLHQTTNYPTMYMTAVQQAAFVKILGETFSDEEIESLIIAYDHNWDEPSYPRTVIGNPQTKPYVAGSAFHCYGGDVKNQGSVNKVYPEKGIWFTECSGGAWATDFSSNMSWNLENVFIGSINQYSKSVLMWNLALDENDGPTNGGCSNCRGVVTIHPDGSYTKNEEYYMIGHFSKFVMQNAKRIEVKSPHESLLMTAFKNPDNTIVIVAHNALNTNMSFNLMIGGTNVDYTINGKTTISFILEEI